MAAAGNELEAVPLRYLIGADGPWDGRDGELIMAPYGTAVAPRLLFQVLAELSVTAGKQAVRTAIAGQAQARTHEGGAPGRLIVLDFGMACEAIHFEDLGLVYRTVNLGEALELGCYGEPRGRHCI